MPATRDLVDRACGGLLREIGRRAAVPAADLDRSLALFLALERELAAHPSGPRGQVAALASHRVARAAWAVVPARARAALDRALAALDDRATVRRRLEDRLAAVPGADDVAAATVYRETLVATFPAERALLGLEALGETAALLHGLLASRKIVARVMRREVYALLRARLGGGEATRRAMDRAWDELGGDPEPLAELARAVREHAPQVVREAYRPAAG